MHGRVGGVGGGRWVTTHVKSASSMTKLYNYMYCNVLCWVLVLPQRHIAVVWLCGSLCYKPHTSRTMVWCAVHAVAMPRAVGQVWCR